MKLSTAYLALLTVIAATLPDPARSYDLIGWPSLFESDLFEPTEENFMGMMIRRQEEFMQHALLRGGSAFYASKDQLINTENEFKIIMDVQGMTNNDINVQFDESKGLLTISGHQHSSGDSEGSSYFHMDSQFSRSFSVDPFVKIDQMTASVDDNGVLTISAPKDIERSHHAVRSIPVAAAATQQQASTKLLPGDPEEQVVITEPEKVPAAAAKPQEDNESGANNMKMLRIGAFTNPVDQVDDNKGNDPLDIKDLVQRFNNLQKQVRKEEPKEVVPEPADEAVGEDQNLAKNPIEKLLEGERKSFKTDFRRLRQ